MNIDTSKIATGVSILGMLQAGVCLALTGKLSRNVRIASGALGALSALGLCYQIYNWRKGDATTSHDSDAFPPDIPKGIVDAVGGQEAWERLPVFEFGDKKRDNIDWVKGDKMSAPVMTGEDAYRRPCLLLRYKPRDLDKALEGLKKDVAKLKRGKIEKGQLPVVSIFFRYSPETPGPKTWMVIENHPFSANFRPLECGSERGGCGYNSPQAHAELKAFIENKGNGTYELL